MEFIVRISMLLLVGMHKGRPVFKNLHITV